MVNLKHHVTTTADNSARRAILEDLFYDFHKRRGQVYWMNFTRGLFFGIGSVVGGTIVVALVVWILSWFTGIPEFGQWVQGIINTIEKK